MAEEEGKREGTMWKEPQKALDLRQEILNQSVTEFKSLALLHKEIK